MARQWPDNGKQVHRCGFRLLRRDFPHHSSQLWLEAVMKPESNLPEKDIIVGGQADEIVIALIVLPLPLLLPPCPQPHGFGRTGGEGIARPLLLSVPLLLCFCLCYCSFHQGCCSVLLRSTAVARCCCCWCCRRHPPLRSGRDGRLASTRAYLACFGVFRGGNIELGSIGGL